MALSPNVVMRRYLFYWGGIILLLSTVNLIRAWRQPSDIWWTPMKLAVPLAESRDRVQIFIRDEPLETLIAGTRLLVAGSSGTEPLRAAEVKLRFNNRDRVRADRLVTVLSAGIGIGAGAILLLIGIVGVEPRAKRLAAF